MRDEPLDPVTMRERGLGFGCGVVSFSGPDTCGVAATAEIMTYMAGATAALDTPMRPFYTYSGFLLGIDTSATATNPPLMPAAM